MDEKKPGKILSVLGEIITAENVQKYILGSKKSGQPRAVYDVVKDYTKPKKKKSKNNGSGLSSYGMYIELKNGKKKKNKKNKDKYWRI